MPLLLGLAASRTARADAAAVASAALFSAAEFSLAVDAAQTMQLVRKGYAEQNPLLGHRPGKAFVLAYFGAFAAGNAAVYTWAPRWASNIVSGAVLCVEVPVVAGNYLRLGLTVSFR